MGIKNGVGVLILISASFFLKVSGQQKSERDSLEQWFSRFGAFRIEAQSPTGQYIALKKTTDRRTDTVMVFNTKKKVPAVLKLSGVKTVRFLGDNQLLAAGVEHAEQWDLTALKKNAYEDVKRSDPLPVHQQYTILDRHQTLRLYSSSGALLAALGSVKNYVTDNRGVLYAEKEDTGGIWKWDGSRMMSVYRSAHLIERLELSGFSAHLLIFEKEKDPDLRRMVVLDSRTGTVRYPLGEAFTGQDYFTFREISEKGGALIKGVSHEKHNKDAAEVWYGNDTDLKSMQLGKTPHEKYWIWKDMETQATALGFTPDTTVSDIGSSRYFIFFRRKELQDYTRSRPLLNVHLYDLETAASLSLGKAEPEIYAAKGGAYILYRRNAEGWELISTLTKETLPIPGVFLRKPVFSTDNKTVYFESGDDLWCYSIAERKLFALKAAPGKETRIVNKDLEGLCVGYSIFRSTADTARPVYVEATDPLTGETSYLYLQHNRIKRTLIKTGNRVSWFTYSASEASWAWLEENYNLPPQLQTVQKKGRIKTLFNGAEADKEAARTRQEITEYSLTDGRQLKGILYYPQHFDASRQYPMVVHVYQIQNQLARDYLLPQYDNVGFNIRTLIEQGYFVYLPDTVIDSRGPGVAGLECVNKALDALLQNKNIDFSKVGLTGHSFGSYLTNFIASQSDRFAAYMSGSGISDMVGPYFSFNYNFHGPYYWQFETGQYQMKKPFAQDRELYYSNNPLSQVQNVNAPVLLWTGKLDENVIPENTMAFYVGLKRNRKNVIALFYPKSGHDVSTDRKEMKDLNVRVLQWWEFFLKDRKRTPWISREMKKDAG